MPGPYDLTLDQVAALLPDDPPFRSRQIWDGLYRRTLPISDMTDLPLPLRERLSRRDELQPGLTLAARSASDGGETVKWGWRLRDGAVIETVLMYYPNRATVCVSTQAGCAMNCSFCATGQAGFTRHLTAGEIVEQVVAAMAEARNGHSAQTKGPPPRIANVVFMGMGEPMANYPAVIGAVRRMTDPSPGGLGLSQRHITVSTVGLVPAIEKLTAEQLNVTLAVSLHAPDDDLRDELVPVNTRWRVGEVLGAAWEYARVTRRRVSIEYALIRDINDQAWRADLLGKRLKGKLAHVNLIPLNPTPGSKWTASRREDEETFVKTLQAWGVPVTVRDTRGREIDGACGQLAAADL
jgi:23S rRNA (adenine2503-C2)-methyltransferase